MAIEVDAAPPGLVTPDLKSLRGPLAVAVACFVVWGLAYGLLDVLNKHFQETLHVGKALRAVRRWRLELSPIFRSPSLLSVKLQSCAQAACAVASAGRARLHCSRRPA